MAIRIPPGDYNIIVTNVDGRDCHVVNVNAVHTKNPTSRILASARGACSYARDHGQKIESYRVVNTENGLIVHEQEMEE